MAELRESLKGYVGSRMLDLKDVKAVLDREHAGSGVVTFNSSVSSRKISSNT